MLRDAYSRLRDAYSRLRDASCRAVGLLNVVKRVGIIQLTEDGFVYRVLNGTQEQGILGWPLAEAIRGLKY